MSRQQNIAAQQHLGELVNSRQFDRLGEVFAADAIDHDPGPDQPAGVEGFQQFFRSLVASFPDAHVEVDTLVADEDHVAVAYRLIGTQLGPFQGVAPTGRKIEVRALQIARFENGMLTERWGNTDEAAIHAQLSG
jgi:steroid delta-isomerase-like uncharacterized protein